jgi:serine/threonine protein phosphatase PrpC
MGGCGCVDECSEFAIMPETHFKERGCSVTYFDFAADSNSNSRPYMEDYYVHKDPLDSDSSSGVWGIFDGHMGTIVAQTLAKKLIPTLEK